ILLTSLIIYHGYALFVWQQQRGAHNDYPAETNRIQMNWLRQFIVLSFIACSMIVAALYLLYINYPNGHEYRYGFAALSIFIYWISYTALNQPVIFSVIKGTIERNPVILPKLTVHKTLVKYANSTLD